MAQVRRSRPAPTPTRRKSTADTPPARRRVTTEEPVSVSLSTTPSEPVKDMGELNWLLYGERKIGKTSLASMFPNAHFLMFEPGGKGLRIHAKPVPAWSHFKAFVTLFEKDRQFTTVVIDTVDIAYEKCFEYVCSRENFTHPNERPYGEGWNLIRKEFEGEMARLVGTGKGIVFISHADDKEFQTRSGRSYQKLVASMSKQARTYVGGLVDVIAYYGYYGNNRFLTLKGSDDIDAGHRLKFNFRTKSGKRIHSVPMFDPAGGDFGEEEAYANLVKAFKNLQVKTWEPEENPTLSDIPVKRTKRS